MTNLNNEVVATNVTTEVERIALDDLQARIAKLLNEPDTPSPVDTPNAAQEIPTMETIENLRKQLATEFEEKQVLIEQIQNLDKELLIAKGNARNLEEEKLLATNSLTRLKAEVEGANTVTNR